MPPTTPTVFLIDDDTSVRRALGRVMTSAGLDWKDYDSSESFLAEARPSNDDCIVADMTMPGMSGLDLKARLDASGIHLPLILLTAHDTDETRAAARQAGASAYFRKPVDIQALLDAVKWATQEADSHEARTQQSPTHRRS
jgi:FixJ family two-component response regulator